MGIFLLNPPESKCNPAIPADGRPSHNAVTDNYSWGRCGRCRCVPRFWSIASPTIPGNPYSGVHVLDRHRVSANGELPLSGFWKGIELSNGQFWWLSSTSVRQGGGLFKGWLAFVLPITLPIPDLFPFWFLPGTTANGPAQYWNCLSTNTLTLGDANGDGNAAALGTLTVEPWPP